MTIPVAATPETRANEISTDVPWASAQVLDPDSSPTPTSNQADLLQPSVVVVVEESPEQQHQQDGVPVAAAYAEHDTLDLNQLNQTQNGSSLVYEGVAAPSEDKHRSRKCICVACIAFLAVFIFALTQITGIFEGDDGYNDYYDDWKDEPDFVDSYLPWVRIGEINGDTRYEASGTSVSLSEDGTVVAIGSPGYSNYDENLYEVGRVRIFAYFNETWAQLGDDIIGSAEYGRLGDSVFLASDGNVVAISSTSYYTGSTSEQSPVRVFAYELERGWVQRGTDITNENSPYHEKLPVSLSSNGTVIALGDNFGQAQMYEFKEEDGEWRQRGRIDPVEDHWVSSVSLSSDGTIFVIAYTHHYADSGFVRVYEYGPKGTLSRRGEDIIADQGYTWRGYDLSTSSDGNTLAFGMPDAGEYSNGVVRVLKYDGNGKWFDVGRKIYGEKYYDGTGASVSLNSNGTILAIGSVYSDTGEGKFDSGHVRVLELHDGSWTKIGTNDIDGKARNDQSGASVSLSGDGSIVAIGAPDNKGSLENYDQPGHVRIYEYIPNYGDEHTDAEGNRTNAEGNKKQPDCC